MPKGGNGGGGSGGGPDKGAQGKSYYDRRDVDNIWVGTERDDVMSGNGGNDTIDGGDGNDRIYAGDGDDYAEGGAGNDLITGGNGDDILIGGAGDDYIRGDAGTDTITGGAGADMFEFIDLSGSNLVDGVDTITDFNASEGDRIELRLISESLTFVENADGTSDQFTLTYDGSGTTVLNVYLAGDLVADLTVNLAGEITSTDGFLF
ncbi:type I secretion C-terminal target domain-containing protein [Qipengyuania sp. 1NDH17]|uniref:Type I secretion C-terminal target domain-containing protein n=1 Tax=Qipengyuania polymorpha TaxID=2867234 RepID=A0ABS7J205_9SPHN|nr:type I secretion C-terminal target domain-containing protein [Qipengyuania polymorpha]MBX7458350.1 type I secretion C-terminal target domain-containing protein [Qipengyuania polymorpha]